MSCLSDTLVARGRALFRDPPLNRLVHSFYAFLCEDTQAAACMPSESKLGEDSAAASASSPAHASSAPETAAAAAAYETSAKSKGIGTQRNIGRRRSVAKGESLSAESRALLELLDGHVGAARPTSAGISMDEKQGSGSSSKDKALAGGVEVLLPGGGSREVCSGGAKQSAGHEPGGGECAVDGGAKGSGPGCPFLAENVSGRQGANAQREEGNGSQGGRHVAGKGVGVENDKQPKGEKQSEDVAEASAPACEGEGEGEGVGSTLTQGGASAEQQGAAVPERERTLDAATRKRVDESSLQLQDAWVELHSILKVCMCARACTWLKACLCTRFHGFRD